MTDLSSPLPLASGLVLANRFALAPLTNQQSHPDGVLSDEEFRWLTMRADGGFGLVMTCAAHVDPRGQGFPGQLGIWSDNHLPGLTRLAAAIKAKGSAAYVQLHHAGIRSPAELIGAQPVGPSDHAKTGARGLTGGEVEALIESFIAAGVRARKAGFDGVEVHGAHGYILSAFISPELNQRTDQWGGSIEARSKIVFDILKGLADRCGPKFSLGLRLSPERFGQRLSEVRDVAAQAMTCGLIDFLDMSLWDVRKEPNDAAWAGRTLMSYFTDLARGETRLGAAGMIRTAADARYVLEHGCDFPVIGRGAILAHDFPRRVEADPAYPGVATPVSPEYLAGQGLSPAFVSYMRNWADFVS